MVGLLMLILALMVAIAIKVFMPSQENNTAQTSPTDEQTSTVVKEITGKLDTLKNDLKDTFDAPPEIVPLDVQNGIYVRQSMRNGNWLVTVRYPELALTDFSPAFEFGYPSGAPWGLMRVEHLDATATDECIQPGKCTPYVSFYTFRSSTNYAEGDKGHTFRIAVAYKEIYEREKKIPNNLYAQNKHLYLAEDDEYVYLYAYANEDKEVRAAVELLLSTFVPLNVESK